MPDPTGPLNHEDIHIETLSIVPTSDYSTNYTETGLVGAGRTLGILYSYTGRRLEKAVGRVAHRAGLGPHATYLKIQQLLRTEWKTDNYTSTYLTYYSFPSDLTLSLWLLTSFLGSLICKLSFKLFNYTKYASLNPSLLY